MKTLAVGAHKTMDVHLLIHLERADRDVVWWAETDDVAGFSAAADTLSELRSRALAALVEIAEEDGQRLGRVTERLVSELSMRSVNPLPAGGTDGLVAASTDRQLGADGHQTATFVTA